jgi:hypothetical protein
MQLQTTVPVAANGPAPRRHAAASLIAGGIAAFVAFVFLGAGTWALWVDRIDRDARGFVSIGATELATETYAIESPLTGDGPDWLYGSTVFGTGRVRATSQSATPLFIGIARTSDIARYLGGTGHATIAHLASDELTPHPGAAQSVVPAQLSIWAASTQGVGEQTLLWAAWRRLEHRLDEQRRESGRCAAREPRGEGAAPALACGCASPRGSGPRMHRRVAHPARNARPASARTVGHSANRSNHFDSGARRRARMREARE